MKLVIFITAQTEHTLEIAEAWQKAGTSGVTILEGLGLRRLQENYPFRDDLPLLPSLASLFRQREINTHMLLSVVNDDLPPKLYQCVTDLLGDLTLPNNGFLFTIDVDNVLGMRPSP